MVSLIDKVESSTHLNMPKKRVQERPFIKFGNFLKQRMAQLGVNGADLGVLIGKKLAEKEGKEYTTPVSANTIFSWRTGKSQPSTVHMEVLAELLDVDEAYLWSQIAPKGILYAVAQEAERRGNKRLMRLWDRLESLQIISSPPMLKERIDPTKVTNEFIEGLEVYLASIIKAQETLLELIDRMDIESAK